jgi:hypothetical protein
MPTDHRSRGHVFAAAASLASAFLVQSANAQCAGWQAGSNGAPGLVARAAGVVPCRHLVSWDPDGTGPQAPTLVVAGTFELAGNALTPASIATLDVATGQFQSLAMPPLGSIDAVVASPNGRLDVFGGSQVASLVGGVWSTTTGIPGIRSAARLPNGNIAVGGSFSLGGGLVNVALWNGSAFSSLGGGLGGDVNSLAVLPNGNLVAGGAFSTPSRVAQWNGTNWSGFGTGAAGGDVFAVFVDSAGRLVIGGNFTTAGGGGALGLARWNGSWTSLANGGMSTGTGPGAVFSIAERGNLIVGGSFISMGGNPVAHVAEVVTPANWQPVGSGVDGDVHALHVDASSTITVGGRFERAGFLYASSIASFTSTSTLVHGSGTHLIAPATPDPGNVSAFVNFFGTEMVAGSFIAAGGGQTKGIAQRTPTGFTQTGAGTQFGVDGRVNALVFSSSTGLLAGGDFTSMNGVGASNLAQFGTGWGPFGAGTNGPVHALAAISNFRVLVGGQFTSAGGIPADGLASVAFGTNWSAFGPGPMPGEPVLAAVELPNGNILAGGRINATFGGFLKEWNGTSWSDFQSASPAGPVECLLVRGSGASAEVLVGGSFAQIGGVTALGIARWDATNGWRDLNGGVSPPTVHAMALMPNGDVVAGGSFNLVGFTLPSFVVTNNIARWDVANDVWTAFGSGTDGDVRALMLVAPDKLRVGGDFLAVDGRPSPWVASLVSSCPPNVATVGSGCGPSTPLVLQPFLGSQPWINSNFQSFFTPLVANTVPVMVLGLTSPNVPLSQVWANGAPGCTLLASPDLLFVMTTPLHVLAIPNSPSLVGQSLFEQVVALDFSSSGSSFASNALQLTFGGF